MNEQDSEYLGLTDGSDPSQELNTTSTSRSVKIGIAGATVGAFAVVGSILALGGNAGAQEAPSLVENATVQAQGGEVDDDCLDDLFVELDEDSHSSDGEVRSFVIDDAEWEELEAACPIDFEDIDLSEGRFFDENFADDEAYFEAMEVDFEAFDECLEAQGIDLLETFADDSQVGTMIFVEGDDNASMVSLGDGDSTVNITKTDGVVSIAVEGDAEATDLAAFEDGSDAEFDAAAEACEDELPDDVFVGWGHDFVEELDEEESD